MFMRKINCDWLLVFIKGFLFVKLANNKFILKQCCIDVNKSRFLSNVME